MKLTKKEAQKIANLYLLGNVKQIKPLTEGWVNDSFVLKTEKGKFVVQFLGRKYDSSAKKKMKLQFKVLNYLKKKKFPYEIPFPLESKQKTYLLKFKNKGIWVYPFIEGEVIKWQLTRNEFKRIIKVMTDYHKYIWGLGDQGDGGLDNFDWLIKKYRNLKKNKQNKKLDKLMKDNIHFFINVCKKLKELKWGKLILTHSDISYNNVIVNKGKITGIIDFDNICASPRVRDLAISMIRNNYLGTKWSKNKTEFMVKEYEKSIKLSKKEKDLIIPLILREYASVFLWFYNGMKKNRKYAFWCMEDAAKESKKLVNELGWNIK